MNKSGLNRKIHFLSGILAVLLQLFLVHLLFTCYSYRHPFSASGSSLSPDWYGCFLFPWFISALFDSSSRNLKGISTRGRFFLLLFSFLFGLLIVSTTNQPQALLSALQNILSISLSRKFLGSPAGERIVTITGFTNQYGDVSFSQFQQTGTLAKRIRIVLPIPIPLPHLFSGRAESAPPLKLNLRIAPIPVKSRYPGTGDPAQ